jgi:organic hydroperoxide reductase OsmC/OhrA
VRIPGGASVSDAGRHRYSVRVTWTGNLGEGTRSYRGYSRAHEISAAGKPVIRGSADPAFRGDATCYSPEDLLVGAISACHMLWYLHLCADAGIVVLDYTDDAAGLLLEDDDGGGRFDHVLLRPHVLIAPGGDAGLAASLHDRAHRLCFIAGSVRFPVRCEPVTRVAEKS